MAAARKKHVLSTVQIGLILTVVLAGLGVALFQKQHIATDLKSGDTIKADFSRDYRLRDYISKVKIAGVQVGTVTGIKQINDTTVEVSMKINKGMRKVLGSEPSANVRSVTLLAGNYYVDLVPGGDRDVAQSGVIPMSRTSVPVELDQVVNTFTTDTRTATQGDTDRTDETLTAGGTTALQGLTAAAPKALPPATDVFTALQGTQPKIDLENLVTGLESTSRQLSESSSDFSSGLQGLHSTSDVLAANAQQIAKLIGDGPAAMTSTQQGMAALKQSLDALEKTDKTAGPEVAALSTLLDHATPALAAARPAVADLRPLMSDLRVTVNQLVPTVTSTQQLLDDVKSPVIDRFSGPILNTVLSPYRNGTQFYKELAYMFAGMNATSMTTDANGPMIDFQAGGGAGSANMIADLLGLPDPSSLGIPNVPATTAKTGAAKTGSSTTGTTGGAATLPGVPAAGSAAAPAAAAAADAATAVRSLVQVIK